MSTQARVQVYVVDHPYMQGAVETIRFVVLLFLPELVAVRVSGLSPPLSAPAGP